MLLIIPIEYAYGEVPTRPDAATIPQAAFGSLSEISEK